MNFLEETEFKHLVESAGFVSVRVDAPDLKEFAIQAGVPAEALELFSSKSWWLLQARRP